MSAELSAGVALLLKAIAEVVVTSVYISPLNAGSQTQFFCANWSLKFFSFCLSLFCETFIRDLSLNASPSLVSVAGVF